MKTKTGSGSPSPKKLGPFLLNQVAPGDCAALVSDLPSESVDIVVTSPPYWGQRLTDAVGGEADPRDYLSTLVAFFRSLKRVVKPSGIVWVNLGDAYNTPINWSHEDHVYSTLGSGGNGLSPQNSAYVKPRGSRRAFTDPETPWLTYGNLLALPYRLVLGMCDAGYIFRGEVIWRKRNAMPEGRCRRPHRQHEAVYLFSVHERHSFRVSPPVKSVWDISNEPRDGLPHYSRFPTELPRRCIEAYGQAGPDVIVLDPFSGSGTSGVAAGQLGCSYIGFEIDLLQVEASNMRLQECWP